MPGSGHEVRRGAGLNVRKSERTPSAWILGLWVPVVGCLNLQVSCFDVGIAESGF